MSSLKLHVRNIFELFIPLSGFAKFNAALTTSPSFGITLTQHDAPSLNYHYQIQIFEENDNGEFILVPDVDGHESFAWGKRSPYAFQTVLNSSALLGLSLKLKINHGVFQFRKIKKRDVRFQVNCFSSGQFLQRGISQTCELYPKKRTANDSEETDTITIPITWISNELLETSPNFQSADQHFYGTSNSSPDEDLRSAYDESPINNSNIHITNSSEMDTSGDDSSYHASPYTENQNQIVPTHYADPDQYMVLYDGNAEVMGNFRALNFYKASDINLKEDIRLLMEDRDCREALLKIDGVEYKFKDHVAHATNKRFIGYIAQQIESVIPEAVQLIDGILHVDYESLIPYLSESVKQNFKDLLEVKSETERINKIVDILYAEFTQKEQKRREKQKRREQQQKEENEPEETVSENAPFIEPLDTEESFSKKKSSFSTTVKSVPKKWFFIIGLIAMTVILSGSYVAYRINHRKNTPDLVDVGPPSDDPVIRAALAEFFIATKGNSWKFGQGWMQKNLTYCKWRAVTCNNQSEIIGLYLANNNLYGTIPLSIGQIKTLQGLYLSDNSLTGTVPTTISMLNELTEVDISRNNFDTWSLPEEFSNLKKLKKLFLTETNLIGTLPNWLSNMKVLKSLYMDNNRLRGTIPELSSSLRAIDLSTNQLTGSVPKFSENTTQIEVLKIATNKLTGDLKNLQTVAWLDLLDLSTNQMSGEISSAGSGVLESIVNLDLQNNQFVALNYISEPRKMVYCNVANNNFKCPIGPWLKTKCNATCKWQ